MRIGNKIEHLKEEWMTYPWEVRKNLLRKAGIPVARAEQELPMVLYGIDKKNADKLFDAIIEENIEVKTISLKFSDGKVRKVPFVSPMRPSSHEGPTPKSGYLAEEKKDGSMTYQYIVDGAIAYVNRHAKNKTEIYPELTDDEPEKIVTKGLTITQGETYVLGGGKDTFEYFQRRNLLQDPEEAKARQEMYPLRYEAFDILMKDDDWAIDLPLEKRKEILRDTIPKNMREVKVTGYSLRPENFEKRMREDPTVEGIVLKRRGSLYKSDKPEDWTKIKFTKEADTVIMGYEKGKGKRRAIGTLQVGVWDPKKRKVIEVANVGTGFTDEELASMKTKIDNGERLYAKVEYLKVGTRGRLRIPSFKGLRDDIGIKDTHL